MSDDLFLKRINIVIKLIITYFYDNDIKSSCLAQSYLLYKYLTNINKNPKLIKGYIINDVNKFYYCHFWVECDNIKYDIATETYLLYYDIKHHNKIRNDRVLSVNEPKNYKNIDNNNYNKIINNSFNQCLNNLFLEDVKQNTSEFVYYKIKNIYDNILKLSTNICI
jgi:hypothetical protein